MLVVGDSAEEGAYLPALESAATEIGRLLLFRDWLRENADDRDLYACTKLELARKQWKQLQD